jgi:transcriptional regulator with XRE-family HTH domain
MFISQFGNIRTITKEKEATQMVFEYGKLLGRIREKGFTQAQLARLAGMTPGTLSQKLNNQAHFKQKEITDICEALEIPAADLGAYFFTQEVRKNTNDEVEGMLYDSE